MQNQIIKGFQEYFCYRFLSMFKSSDIESIISPKINQIYEKNNPYKMKFKNFETSFNIQNGGANSTNVKIFNCP